MKCYPITSKNFISLLLLLFKVCWALPAPASVTKCPANIIMKRSSANELVKPNESQNSPNFMNGSHKRFSKSELPTSADRVRLFSLRSAFKVIKPKTTSTTISTSKMSNAQTNRSNGKCPYEPTPYYRTNFDSNCRSYSFCSAGYEITYLCSPNQLFNGTKCVDEADYTCPGGRNDFYQNQNCKLLPNRYYKNEENPQLYFYCYNGNRVIDLSCPKGRVFDGDKCIIEPKIEENEQPLFRIASVKKKENKFKLDLNQLNSCTDKENGFFTEIGTSCKKYYFCIAEVKTPLECSGNGRIFNGDICVNDGDFKCNSDNEIEIESTNE